MRSSRSTMVPPRGAVVPWRIAVAVVITLAIGLGSGLLMGDAMESWYPALNKPSFQPPASVFAPVWTVLYLLMGVAAGLVWSRARMPGAGDALAAYGAQLVLNAGWTGLFFGLREPWFALVDIIALLLLIVQCMVLFKKVNALAMWLLLPYLLWVIFATVLNISIIMLN